MGNTLSPAVHEPISSHQGQISPERELSVDELRGKVAALRVKCNEAWQLSRNCFDRGDHVGAKKYSKMGKDLDAEVKALSQALGDKVYEQNNRRRRKHIIDLHGLSQQQAVVKVEAALVVAKQEHEKSLNLIVGKGNRSGPGGPKLKPAIVRYLEHRKIPYEDGRPNEGCLFVDIEKWDDEAKCLPSAADMLSQQWNSKPEPMKEKCCCVAARILVVFLAAIFCIALLFRGMQS